MLAFKLYVAVFLISLGSVLANTDVDVKYSSHPGSHPRPYPPKPHPPPKDEGYSGVLSNAASGTSKYKVPGKPCKATFKVYGINFDENKIKLLAESETKQSVSYPVTKKYQVYIFMFDNAFLIADTYENLVIIRKTQDVKRIEVVVYGYKSECGTQYYYTTNALKDGEKTVFKEQKYKPKPEYSED